MQHANSAIAHGKRSRHNSCQRSMAGVLPFAVCGFHSSLRSRSAVCRSEHLCQVFVQCFQKELLVLLHHGHELGQLSSTKLLWDGDPRPERGPQPVHNLLVGVHAFTCNTHTQTYTHAIHMFYPEFQLLNQQNAVDKDAGCTFSTSSCCRNIRSVERTFVPEKSNSG